MKEVQHGSGKLVSATIFVKGQRISGANGTVTAAIEWKPPGKRKRLWGEPRETRNYVVEEDFKMLRV